VPRTPGDAAREDGDRIRVCNYCFKRWREEQTPAARRDASQPSSPVLSPTPSAASVGSDKSCSTGRGSAVTNGQMSSYANLSCTDFGSLPVDGEGRKPDDASLEKQRAVMEPAGSMDHVDNPPDPFNFCLNRYAFFSLLALFISNSYINFFLKRNLNYTSFIQCHRQRSIV
jgi:1-phosphatidylinositol-3-phosphate 5-kinase